MREEFDAFLSSKKICPEKFRIGDASAYAAWEKLFGLVHPASFVAQKLYLLNAARRKFPLRPQD